MYKPENKKVKKKRPTQKVGYRVEQISKKEIKVAKKYLKKCSASLVIREMQIKARMAKINKTPDKECWRCGERGILIDCWWDCKLVHPQWKSV